jgi:predicted CoA-binding protein
MTSKKLIDDFLARKRFAFVGVSRSPKDFSRILFREFCARGYEPVPVHPSVEEIEGQPCYASLAAIQPPVDSALFMTPPSVTRVLAEACAEAGIRRVWMYRGASGGAVDGAAVASCAMQGISVIPGECPLMFLSGASWIHRLHGLLKRMRGTYPR